MSVLDDLDEIDRILLQANAESAIDEKNSVNTRTRMRQGLSDTVEAPMEASELGHLEEWLLAEKAIMDRLHEIANLGEMYGVVMIAALARERTPGDFHFITGLVTNQITKKSSIIKLAATLARVNATAGKAEPK